MSLFKPYEERLISQMACNVVHSAFLLIIIVSHGLTFSLSE